LFRDGETQARTYYLGNTAADVRQAKPATTPRHER
jgi:hypothetical protein